MPARLPESDPSVCEVGELYTNGLSINEIVRKLGKTEGWVRKRIKRAGVRSRPVGAFIIPGMVSLWGLCKSGGRHFSYKTVKEAVERVGVVPIRRWGRDLVSESAAAKVRQALSDRYRLHRVDWKAAGIAEWEMGWLGGILDGEGCLDIRAGSTGSGTCVVTVASSTRVVLEKTEELLAKMGVDHGRSVVFHGVQHTLICGAVKVWAVLTAVLPFLVLKREDAEVLLEFCERWSKAEGRLGTNKKLVSELRPKLLECRKDKLRGVKAEEA